MAIGNDDAYEYKCSKWTAWSFGATYASFYITLNFNILFVHSLRMLYVEQQKFRVKNIGLNQTFLCFFSRVFSLLLVLADIIIVIVDLATEAQSEKVNKIPVKNLKNLADFMTFVTWN